jgi:hypothetical protein
MTTLTLTDRIASNFVGREDILEKIETFGGKPDDGKVYTILLGGEGGIGKTSVLEEVLKRYEQNTFWNTSTVALVKILDLINPRTMTLHGLKEEFRRETSFEGDDIETYLRTLTEKGRVVLLFDTIENLDEDMTSWLVRNVFESSDIHKIKESGVNLRDLKSAESIVHNTVAREWLLKLLYEKIGKNFTVVFAGRNDENKPERFFNKILTSVENYINVNGLKREEVFKAYNLSSFSLKETKDHIRRSREHLQLIADELESTEVSDPATAFDLGHLLTRISRLDDIITDFDKIQYIHDLTQGIPIHLSFYIHLLVTRSTIPANLLYHKEPNGNEPIKDLVSYIFSDLEMGENAELAQDEETRILSIFLRTPFGLTIEQLEYLLDAFDQNPRVSRTVLKSNPRRLESLHKTLERMTKFYLVRQRSSGVMLSETDEGLQQKARYGLREPIYEIFARILQRPADHEPSDSRHALSYKREQDGRRLLYQYLITWIEEKRRDLIGLKQTLLRQDETELRRSITYTSKPEVIQFPDPDISTQLIERYDLDQAIEQLDLELLYYQTMKSPGEHFNRTFFALMELRGDSLGATNFVAESVLWSILNSHHLINFASLEGVISENARARREDAITVLRRAARSTGVAQWIRRLVLMGNYKEAIALGQAIEVALELLYQRQEDDEFSSEWDSWVHTLSYCDRRVWYCRARLYSEPHNHNAIMKELVQMGEALVTLEKSPHPKVALFAPHFGRPYYQKPENGFASPIGGQPHPAIMRLRRHNADVFNTIGFGYRMEYNFPLAVYNYKKAIGYLDRTGSRVLRAVILTNWSRALLEMGYRSLTLCNDAIETLFNLGEDSHFPLAYNTKALILDDLDQPQEAWLWAAIALAYAKRSKNRRAEGLASLQLAESLRHVAQREYERNADSRNFEEILSQSIRYLQHAMTIFQALGEKVLEMEAQTELACVHRDRMRFFFSTSRDVYQYYANPLALATDRIRLAQRDFDKARALFKEVLVVTKPISKQLWVDAQINYAVLLFHYAEFFRHDDYLKASPYFEQVEETIGEIVNVPYVQPYHAPRPSSVEPIGPIRTPDFPLHWLFHQLDKVHDLVARVAEQYYHHNMAQLKESVEFGGSEKRDLRRDALPSHPAFEQVRLALKRVAENYCQAVLYGRRFAENPPGLTITLTRLEKFIGRCNPGEQKILLDSMKNFRAFEHLDQPTSEERAIRDFVTNRLLLFFGVDDDAMTGAVLNPAEE